MKPRLFHQFIFLLAIFAFAACSSDDVPTPSLPVAPGGGNQGGPDKAGETFFKGLWVSTCQEEDVPPFKSYRVEFNFTAPKMAVDTHYFAEDGCVDQQQVIEMDGQFKATQALTQGDNFITFSEDSGDTFYFRTMVLNDGTFIITKLKNSSQAATSAVAEIVLERP